MQAYIRKIEETGDDDEEELGQHTITIAPAGSSHHDADDGTTTVYAQVCFCVSLPHMILAEFVKVDCTMCILLHVISYVSRGCVSLAGCVMSV